MTDDLREQAQLTQRDDRIPIESIGTPRLMVANVIGESAHGYSTRAMRFATPDDVRALMPELFTP